MPIDDRPKNSSNSPKSLVSAVGHNSNAMVRDDISNAVRRPHRSATIPIRYSPTRIPTPNWIAKSTESAPTPNEPSGSHTKGYSLAGMPSAAMITPQNTWVISASRHCAQVSGNLSMRAAIRPAATVLADWMFMDVCLSEAQKKVGYSPAESRLAPRWLLCQKLHFVKCRILPDNDAHNAQQSGHRYR